MVSDFWFLLASELRGRPLGFTRSPFLAEAGSATRVAVRVWGGWWRSHKETAARVATWVWRGLVVGNGWMPRPGVRAAGRNDTRAAE